MMLKVATVQMTTDDRDKVRVVDKVLRMIDEAGAQILVGCSAFLSPRLGHWELFLRARARAS